MATLSNLRICPLKSCRGLTLAHARLGALGLDEDRAWMVVDSRARFRTQRERPRLCLVEVEPTAGQNAVPLATGTLEVGDEVRVLELR